MRAIAPADPFEHIGLLYRDEREYAQACAAFARRGLSAGEPVMVSVPAANGELIRAELGADAGEVGFADMKDHGRNPGRIIPWVLLDFAATHPGSKVWMIGEPIWQGRTELEYPACATHEALINTAFAGRDAAILCPYDLSHLDQAIIDDSWRTHPIMADGARSWHSPAYDDPIAIAAAFNLPLPGPPLDAERIAFASASDLLDLRSVITRYAEAAGITADKTSQLLIVINELATNSIEHTPAGKGMLHIWAEPDMLVCQIDDYGQLTDPMAGRIPPLHPGRGHGLTLVNQFADLVRIYTHPGGTSFRVHTHTPAYESA